jgi:hypothetical protein
MGAGDARAATPRGAARGSDPPRPPRVPDRGRGRARTIRSARAHGGRVLTFIGNSRHRSAGLDPGTRVATRGDRARPRDVRHRRRAPPRRRLRPLPPAARPAGARDAAPTGGGGSRGRARSSSSGPGATRSCSGSCSGCTARAGGRAARPASSPARASSASTRRPRRRCSTRVSCDPTRSGPRGGSSASCTASPRWAAPTRTSRASSPRRRRSARGTCSSSTPSWRPSARGAALEFDFLRGREPYKYRWGAEDRPTWRLSLTASESLRAGA